MLLIGLTGSIGMGKTETAKMFARHGVPVYDADAAVHALYANGGAAVAPIAGAFPEAVTAGAVDRAALSRLVVGKPAAMKRLEAIIHPLVAKAQLDWLAEQAARGVPRVVLDIPLLFETGGEGRVDVVVVASAPEDVQRARVLARPDMSAEKFEAILAKQVPDAEKRARADFVVETDKGFDHAEAQVREILTALEGREGAVWAQRAKP
jgi:dephospho-CoA kinase